MIAKGTADYKKWINDVITYNKAVFIESRRERQALLNNCEEKKKQLDNYSDTEKKRVENWRYDVSSINKIINDLLISKGKVMPITYGKDNQVHETIQKLQIDIEQMLSEIHRTAQAIQANPPIKFSWGIAILLLCIYVVPGLIYIAVVKGRASECDSRLNTYANYVYNIHNKINRYQELVQEEVTKGKKDLESDYQHNCSDDVRSRIDKAEPLKQNLLGAEYQYGFAALPWNASEWDIWKSTNDTVPPLVRIGAFVFQSEVDQGTQFPAYVPFQQGRGIFYKTPISYQSNAVSSAKSVMLRLLFATKPGKIEFSFIDPIEVGGSVKEFLAIADENPEMINLKTCSSTEQISARLEFLVEQIRMIQQEYLRADFSSIEEYNKAEKIIAEPYRIVYINSFPINFTDGSLQNLVSIVTNGPKCGIYPIIIANTPYQNHHNNGFTDIEHNCLVIDLSEGKVNVKDPRFDMYELILDSIPNFNIKSLFKKMIIEVAKQGNENKRVVFSYQDMLRRAGLDQSVWWTYNTNTSLVAPMGPCGANKLQELHLDEDEMHNAAICVGRPGAGKSNLMTTIIVSLALKYSSNELELYLIDLKNGVTFKPFATNGLSCARTIAIDSDREFALAVLQGLGGEMERRGCLLRDNNVNSIAAYRTNSGKALPRILLVMDEFQDLFNINDSICNEATSIIEKIIRKGRQLGVHLFMATQSLASIAVAKPIMDLIAVRIALQCSDAESRTVLSDNNGAAGLLSRPGEAIYNERNGLYEANEHFQAAFFMEEDYAFLDEIQKHNQGEEGLHKPVVFDGSIIPRLDDTSMFHEFLNGRKQSRNKPFALIGKPVSMEQTRKIDFRRQSGEHLCILDSKHEEGIGVFLSVLLSLIISGYNHGIAIIYMSYDSSETENNLLVREMSNLLGSDMFKMIRRIDLAETIHNLRSIACNKEQTEQFETFLLIDAFHSARDFEVGYDQPDTSIGMQFRDILKYGPDNGVHVIIRSESFERIKEIIGTDISEFNYRAAGSMDSTRSINYIDDSHAARLDKDNRMVLYNAVDALNRYSNFIPFRVPSIDLLRNLKTVIETEKE